MGLMGLMGPVGLVVLLARAQRLPLPAGGAAIFSTVMPVKPIAAP